MLQAAAKSSLASVSGDRRTITTGLFRMNPETDVPNYALPPNARRDFMVQAFELLSTPATQPSGKRLKIIELPQTNKVIVSELNEVKPVTDDNPVLLSSIGARQQALGYDQFFRMDWFNWDSVANRLKYKPVEKNS
jgi:hypothetical protein